VCLKAPKITEKFLSPKCSP